MNDAEVDGGLTKVREQLIQNDAKMYVEDNPDAEMDLDPLTSGWGMNNSYMPDEGLVG